MQCRFCGNENSDGAANCFICGKPLNSNIATNLVDIGQSDGSLGSDFSSDAQAHANRFASDTGGGPVVGPQKSFAAQMTSGSELKEGSGGSVMIVLLVILLVCAVGWYLFFSPAAPLGYLLNSLLSSLPGDAQQAAEGATQATICNIFTK